MHETRPTKFNSSPLKSYKTFQLPKMEVFTYVSCMDTAYGYGSFPTPKIAEHKVQETQTILGT